MGIKTLTDWRAICIFKKCERFFTLPPFALKDERSFSLRSFVPVRTDSGVKEVGPISDRLVGPLSDRLTAVAVSTQPEKWSSQDKLCIVIETAGMTDTELAEYAGKKGLSADEINAWREACMNANGGSAREPARLQRENRELERKLRSTERELARKEKVLAEVAALLVLGKKAGAVWGDQEAE